LLLGKSQVSGSQFWCSENRIIGHGFHHWFPVDCI
jgi:hypothetical protein